MLSRREFVVGAGSALALSACHKICKPPAPKIGVRRPWSDFKAGPTHASFVAAISTMRANVNASDPNSWLYWANVHENFCPHGVAYFLAWHRGYLLLFESKLRELSGDTNLWLPYWDYYTTPVIPSEFTTPGSNPLFHDRGNTDVSMALSLAPFDPVVTDFQTGTANAFEPSLESMPHNQVHNIVGNIMATFQSPQDPIFWLHHANIDRLWDAWVLADSGRQMPPISDAYWASQFDYAPGVTLDRKLTFDTQGIGYTYQDQNMPTQLPTPEIPLAPAIKKFAESGKKEISPSVTALGGVRGIALDQSSVSVAIPVKTEAKSMLLDSLSDKAAESATPTVRVVLDDVKLTDAGKSGGYFYKIYVNLPKTSDAKARERDYLIGTLGPFEIAAAAKHASHTGGNVVQFSLPVGEVLRAQGFSNQADLTVSFVRVSASSSPQGDVIFVGEARVEVGVEPPK